MWDQTDVVAWKVIERKKKTRPYTRQPLQPSAQNAKKADCDKQCVTGPTTKTIQTDDGPTFHELEETM